MEKSGHGKLKTWFLDNHWMAWPEPGFRDKLISAAKYMHVSDALASRTAFIWKGKIRLKAQNLTK